MNFAFNVKIILKMSDTPSIEHNPTVPVQYDWSIIDELIYQCSNGKGIFLVYYILFFIIFFAANRFKNSQ